jgi:5-formyltetrahydrofolate cyclo-ligase
MDVSKKEVRAHIKNMSSKLTSEEKRSFSERTLYILEHHPVFIQSDIIAMYWSLDDEIKTHDFILKWSKVKTILLPVLHEDDLYFATFNSVNDLVSEDKYGIPEPQTGKIYNIDTIQLIVVPGIAFDQKNNRLGRGKGFYDRALKACNCTTIGICFPHQILNEIPVEPHDIKVDEVLFA